MATLDLDHGRSSAAYRAAVRHSGRVRFLKLAFPLFSLVVLVGFIAISMINQIVPSELVIDGAALEDGKLVMNNPSMSGQTDGARNYNVTATRAIQDLSVPDVIELEEIVADMPVNATDRATVTALRGRYNRVEEHIQFPTEMQVEMTNGLTASFQAADFNIRAGNFRTDQPVQIATEQGTLAADQMQMDNNGERVLFSGNVKMVLNPGTFGSQTAE